MIGWTRLAVIAVIGLAAMAALTVGLIMLRNVLSTHGYDVHPLVFIVTFFLLVGSVYGLAANLVLREIKKHKKGVDTPDKTDSLRS